MPSGDDAHEGSQAVWHRRLLKGKCPTRCMFTVWDPACRAWNGESTSGVESALNRMPHSAQTRALSATAASVSEFTSATSGAKRAWNSGRQRSRGSSKLHPCAVSRSAVGRLLCFLFLYMTHYTNNNYLIMAATRQEHTPAVPWKPAAAGANEAKRRTLF